MEEKVKVAGFHKVSYLICVVPLLGAVWPLFGFPGLALVGG